jgi:hypothetical protein
MQISYARSTLVAIAVVSGLVSVAGGQIQYQNVALTGQPALGLPAGVNYSTLSLPAINNARQVVYIASFDGPGVTAANNLGHFAGDFSGPQLVARMGNAAPGTAVGVTYRVFSTLPLPSLSDAGQVAYLAGLAGPGVVTGQNDVGSYAGTLASPQLVARTGAAAPGTSAGVKYKSFTTPALNDNGQMAYLATFAGPDVIEPDIDGNPLAGTNSFALYTGTLASPQLIARAGNAAPGIPEEVRPFSFTAPVLNDMGQVAYGAFLMSERVGDGGVIVADQRGSALYAGDPGFPQLIARTGNAAPGTPADVIYDRLGVDAPALNDNGQVAYRVSLGGPGVTTRTRRHCSLATSLPRNSPPARATPHPARLPA